LHLLRQRIFELSQLQSAPFKGQIEVDESYFGVRRVKGMNKNMFELHLKKYEFRFNNRKQNLYTTLLEVCRKEPLN